ncbi:Cellular retinoic acid-binding protein 1 [Holothuria leucospilota]|uniref:Cellular retinoic acid-binding protein 1 n=1 Tax=Holothuria leucospilota TaxID=206669 RepID=A0A9Q1CGP6_HOLLE|nr:Cellular retinoic acid-binding protein 1 [Holothuria leucospilota]
MAQLVGKWKLDRSEKFEEYMVALGVSLPVRKAALIMPSPTCDIQSPAENQFVIKMNVPVIMTHVQNFVIGEPFEDLVPNGEKQMTVVTKESDSKLIFREEKPSEPPHIVTRELEGDEMVMTLQKGDVTCTRVFKRA